MQGSKAALAVITLLLGLLVAEHASARTRRMLVIGNATYTAEPQLVTAGGVAPPVNDATAIHAAMLKMDWQGELRLNVSWSEMRVAFDQLIDSIRPDDDVFVYFSGHGVEPKERGVNYMLPIDANGTGV